jgi:hypothetical protein
MQFGMEELTFRRNLIPPSSGQISINYSEGLAVPSFRVDECTHVFLTLAPDGGEWLAPHSSQNARYSYDTVLDRPHSSGRCGELKDSISLNIRQLVFQVPLLRKEWSPCFRVRKHKREQDDYERF